LQLGSFQTERVNEERRLLVTRRVRDVVVATDRRVVRHREFVVTAIGTVDLEFRLVRRGHHTVRGAVRHEELHRVIKRELLDFRLTGDNLLCLGNQHAHRLRGHHGAFIRVQENVVRVGFPLVASRGGTPVNSEFDIMILHGDQRKRGLPVFAKLKSEGIKLFSRATTVDATTDRLRRGRRQKFRRNHRRERRILFIDQLSTNEQFDLGNLGFPIGHSGRLGTVGVNGGKVNVGQHVSLSLEANGGHAIVLDVALYDLTFTGLRKIRRTFVRRAEKADFGLADQMGILSTDGH